MRKLTQHKMYQFLNTVKFISISWIVSAGLFSVHALGRQLLTQDKVEDPTPKLSANQLADKATELPVTVTLEYRSDEGGYFLAPIELPSLEGGKKYKLRILAHNPTDRSIFFSRIIAECTCAKFETDIDSIRPHDSGVFFMYLDAPAFGGRGVATTGAKFLDTESQTVVMRLNVKYELNNVFSLPGRRLSIEVSDELNEVTQRIPITIVPPLKLEDLEVKVDDSLKDMSVRLIEKEQLPYLEIMVPKQIVTRKGMFGQIYLQRKESSQSFVFVVDVKRQEKITVSPESLRFTSIPNEPGRYEATAMLRIVSSTKVGKIPEGQLEHDGNEPEVIAAPEISIKVGEESAKVTLKPLGKRGLFRVRIVSEHTSEVEENLPVIWLLKHGKEERKIESLAFFSW